jgi:fucose 4-O-acetylase-like acetyltransferase
MTAVAQTRIYWIDFARGIGMLAVIVGHCWDGLGSAGLIADKPLFDAVYSSIYLFHMPLFFLLSGITAGLGFPRPAIWRHTGFQIYKFLYAMIVWIYLFMLLKYIAGSAANDPVQLSDFLQFPLPPKDHLWFLWALSLIMAVSPLALLFGAMFRGREGWALFGLALVSWPLSYWWMADFEGAIRPLISSAVRDLPIFLLGLAIGVARVTRPDPRAALIGAAVFFGLQATLLAGPEGYTDPRFVGHLAAIGFLAFAAQLSTVAPTGLRDLFCWLGRITMTLYLAHTVFSAFTRIALSAGGVDSVAVHLVAGTLTGVIGPVVMLAVARRLRVAELLGLEGAPRLPATPWGRWARS